MPISEDLGTDIDIVIAMWINERRIENMSWENRCALRKRIYDLFIAELKETTPTRVEFVNPPKSKNIKLPNAAIAFVNKVSHARDRGVRTEGGCQECNIDALVDEAQELLDSNPRSCISCPKLNDCPNSIGYQSDECKQLREVDVYTCGIYPGICSKQGGHSGKYCNSLYIKCRHKRKLYIWKETK